MYQSIDDTAPEAANDLESQRQASRRRMILAVCLGILILIIAAMGSNQSDPNQQLAKDQAMQRQDYLAAISSQTPSLRRARLTDLLQTYPGHDRLGAIRAQLGVIDQSEAADWAALSNIFYNPESDPVEKSIALDRYALKWGPALVGGRETEVAQFRAALESGIPAIAEFDDGTQTEDLPDFSPSDTSSISEKRPV